MGKTRLKQIGLLKVQGYKRFTVHDAPHGFSMDIFYRESDGHIMRMLDTSNGDDETYIKWTEEALEKFKKKYGKVS